MSLYHILWRPYLVAFPCCFFTASASPLLSTTLRARRPAHTAFLDTRKTGTARKGRQERTGEPLPHTPAPFSCCLPLPLPHHFCPSTVLSTTLRARCAVHTAFLDTRRAVTARKGRQERTGEPIPHTLAPFSCCLPLPLLHYFCLSTVLSATLRARRAVHIASLDTRKAGTARRTRQQSACKSLTQYLASFPYRRPLTPPYLCSPHVYSCSPT